MALEKQAKNPEAGGMPQRADDMPSPHRRKLIKGAVAAPAILTLHSGGVLARTSFGATIGAEPAQGESGICIFPQMSGTDDLLLPADPWYPCLEHVANDRPEGKHCDAGDTYCAQEVAVVAENLQTPKQCTRDLDGSNAGGFFATATSGGSLIMRKPC